MNKRGQVYVLAAIVMSIIIFGMVSISNRAVQESIASDFERIANNYATETAKLVNSIPEEQDIRPAFRNFTLLFASYAKAQSPKFELISVLDYNSQLYIGNFLKERIIVKCNDNLCDSTPPVEGCYSNVPASVGFEGLKVPVTIYQQSVGNCETIIPYDAIPVNYINISIANVAYQFDLRKDQPEVIVVGWESNAKQRKVYTKGNFIASSANLATIGEYCASHSPACSEEYCTDACLPICGLMQTEDECNANSADCRWDASLDIPCTGAAAE